MKDLKKFPTTYGDWRRIRGQMAAVFVSHIPFTMWLDSTGSVLSPSQRFLWTLPFLISFGVYLVALDKTDERLRHKKDKE